MKLVVDPIDALVDHLPRIELQGVPAGAPARLLVEGVDGAGNRWRSITDLGSDGTPPEPTEPWWSMTFDSEGVPPVVFEPSLEPVEFSLRAQAGGQEAGAVAIRRWARDVARTEIGGEGFRLTVFVPTGGPRVGRPGVVVVPGSMGAAGLMPTASLLASHGYAAAVLAYVQGPGLPPSLRSVPLEALAAGIRTFAALPTVDADRLAVYAVSVGTGGAESVLATWPDLGVRAYIGVGPTHVVWQALGERGTPPDASSWSLGGADLPWAPVRSERLLGQVFGNILRGHFGHHSAPRPLRLLPAYGAGLRARRAVEAASIPVERIPCPVLLLSGDDDGMWPASEMAAAIIARRARSEDRHLAFPGSGHFFRPPYVPTTVPWTDSLYSGGTPAGIADAQARGWQAVREFLAEWVGPPPPS